MKKSQNLVLYFAAFAAMLVAYVFAAAQIPDAPGIPYLIVGGLGVCALAQVISDLLEKHKSMK